MSQSKYVNFGFSWEINTNPFADKSTGKQACGTVFTTNASWGLTPRLLSKPIILKNICCEMAENEFLLFNKKLGVRIYVVNGNEIIIDENSCADIKDILVYLRGSVTGALLHMNNYVPMHASTVLTDKGSILFTGVSGAGKSTIAFALHRRGYNVICDDISPIKNVEEQLFVYPGFSQFKLWEDSLKLNKSFKKEKVRIRDSINKYYIDFENEIENKPYPIYKIYNLRIHNSKKILTIEKTKEIDRLKILNVNTYRRAYVKGLNKEAVHFRVKVKLAKFPMTTIDRPYLPDNFEEYVDRVEEDMLK